MQQVKLATKDDIVDFVKKGIGFDAFSQFSWSDCSWSKNVVIFEADKVLLCTLIIKKDTTVAAEAKYCINFTRIGRTFVLNKHYNRSNIFLFANSVKNISIQSNKLRNKIIFIVFR